MICTERDNYIVNYQECNPSWIVRLSSGLAVFQDDGRPGVTPESAWLRLRAHCQETGDYITEMKIKFRSNVHVLPANADGYYFSKGARGGLSMTRTMQLFFVGVLNQLCLISKNILHT
jgi:hypothetical protein